jgi:hypothetical protein
VAGGRRRFDAGWGAEEGVVIALAGEAPYDELLAERVVLGVLGIATSA